MVSCLLTRVILNVSVALTVQCYRPDGSVYNKTICSLMPSNLAKIELLRDLFREHNMSVPENLVTTPVELLEPISDDDDVYIDEKRIKFRNRPGRLGTTRIHPYSIMTNNSKEHRVSKAKSLNKFKPKSLELKFNYDDTKGGKTEDTLEIVEVPHTPTEPQEEVDTKQREEIKAETTPEISTPDTTTKHLSLHDQFAISLERQMKLIEDNEDMLKAQNKDEPHTTIPADDYFQALNTTHYLHPNITAYLEKFKPITYTRSLSEELQHYHDIAESIQKIMVAVTEDPRRNVTRDDRTINTENIRYQFEKESNEKEDDKEDVSLGQRVKVIQDCMRQARHMDAQDLTTKVHEQTNRIEKRSIPNTNPDSNEKKVTFLKSKENDKLRVDQSKSNEKHDKPFLPGVDNFWNVFVTSPVALILNSTSIYDRYASMITTSYEKKYYDNLVKNLKEKYATQSSDHTEDQTEESKIYVEETKGYNNQYDTDELTNMFGNLVNYSSIEKGVARNLLGKLRKHPVVTRSPKERLGPEKYQEFLELKKSMDEQYNDIKKHMNKTDKEIQRMFMEMRNLKDEKVLNDYYVENEQMYTHYTTPKNYTDEFEMLSVEPCKSSTVNYYLWKNATNFLPDSKGTDRKVTSEDESDATNYQELDGMKTFTINDLEEIESEGELDHLFRSTVQNTHRKYYITQRNTEPYDYESLDKYDRKKFEAIREMELKQKSFVPNMSEAHLEHLHSNFLKRLNKTKSGEHHRITIPKSTVTPKLWFEESVFDENDPKILYAKYLHNVRNITVKLNMEVGKKQIKNITYFNPEDRRYAHQYKTTTECRRFSHIIPFWLTQPKEIEDVFKGNTKIFREYIQYILDKHNFTELPVNGRFAFLRRYINKMNNPLIFNRITIFPTAYVTTDHVLSFRDQFKQFKGHLKNKIHKAYKHVKHYLFNTSLDEGHHDHVPIVNTEKIPDEVIINITTPPPMGMYYDDYD